MNEFDSTDGGAVADEAISPVETAPADEAVSVDAEASGSDDAGSIDGE